MKQLTINSLDELENFISDESVSKKDRLAVFEQSLKGYNIVIARIRTEGRDNLDPDNTIVSQMKRTINQIKQEPTKAFYNGIIAFYN